MAIGVRLGYFRSNVEDKKCPPSDGEDLGNFAFRSAVPELHCLDTHGVAFWVDVVGYGSAVAYGLLIPLFIVAKMQELLGAVGIGSTQSQEWTFFGHRSMTRI